MVTSLVHQFVCLSIALYLTYLQIQRTLCTWNAGLCHAWLATLRRNPLSTYVFSGTFSFGSEDESSSLLRNIANHIQNHSTSSPEYRMNNFHRRVILESDVITECGHYVKPHSLGYIQSIHAKISSWNNCLDECKDPNC